jgi:hypothetical protein
VTSEAILALIKLGSIDKIQDISNVLSRIKDQNILSVLKNALHV